MSGSEATTAQQRLFLLRKDLSRTQKRLLHKHEKQLRELHETERAVWYRQVADSLIADPAGTPRGSAKVSLFNIHTQRKEPVALNPRFDAHENAMLFYRKAKKGERGRDITIRKVAETEAEIKTCGQFICDADAALAAGKEERELLDLCGRIAAALKLPDAPGVSGVVPGTKKQEDVPYRRCTIDDWNIYIGKNDAQNDELSTRFAHPHDLWLHVAGHAGSHVVIRRPDRTTAVPPEVVRKAAALAVWFSKAKHTSYAEVHYTEARFVRKRRHAPPGEVIVERYKSIRVSPCQPEEMFPSKYDEQSTA
jgi:predicted ribosome quality control (RQC) complex YloA/Tae2 family protein